MWARHRVALTKVSRCSHAVRYTISDGNFAANSRFSECLFPPFSPPQAIRQIAVRAAVSPDTVRSVLKGEPANYVTAPRLRALAELHKLGVAVTIPVKPRALAVSHTPVAGDVAAGLVPQTDLDNEGDN